MPNPLSAALSDLSRARPPSIEGHGEAPVFDPTLVQVLRSLLHQQQLALQSDLQAHQSALQAIIEQQLLQLRTELPTLRPADERHKQAGTGELLEFRPSQQTLHHDFGYADDDLPSPNESGKVRKPSFLAKDFKATPVSETVSAVTIEKKPLTFKRVINSGMFESATGAMVIFNVVLMFLQLERQGHQAGVALKMVPDDGEWNGSDSVFTVCEHIFTIWFVMELGLRITSNGIQTLKIPGNFVDALIVVVTSLDLYLFSFLFQGRGSGPNMSFARIVRILKVVKIFRAFRAAALFHELRILITTMVSSIRALMWSMVLLSVILLSAGIFMAQMVGSFIADSTNENDIRVWLWKRYGTAAKSTYTMFELTLSGCWPSYARPLVDEVSVWYALWWFFYVITVVFAVIRIITALFITATMRSANEDEEMMSIRKLKEKAFYIKKLRAFLLKADESGDDKLDINELQMALKDPKIGSWLHVLELEPYEVMTLHEILSTDGAVPLDEFLDGALRMKGPARSIDLIQAMHNQHKLAEQLDELQTKVMREFQKAHSYPKVLPK